MGRVVPVKFPALLPHQREVLAGISTHNVLCWGAQAGKTWFSLLFQAACALKISGNYIWIDRDGKFARRAYRQARYLLPREAVVDVSKVDMYYRLVNGSTWTFFSGVEPDAFRGEGRSGAVFNEASFVPAEAWQEVVAPRLFGWSLFNFTPKGRRNWTFGIWQQADGRNELWRRWHALSTANPLNTPERLEQFRLVLPDAVFRQEFLAEFVSDFGQFFRPAERCWTGAFQSYVPGARYAGGIDWAEVRDFSAWAIVRVDVLPRQLVSFGRLPHIEYTAQTPLLSQRLKQYGNPLCLADASQTTANQLLRQAGCRVEDFHFTQQSKQHVADQLRVAFEQGDILMPAPQKLVDEERKRQALWLADEIEYFEPYLQGGRLKMGARGEHHDDILAALMLALEAGGRASTEHNVGGYISVAGHGRRF